MRTRVLSLLMRPTSSPPASWIVVAGAFVRAARDREGIGSAIER
jgi:hypothetical protein